MFMSDFKYSEPKRAVLHDLERDSDTEEPSSLQTDQVGWDVDQSVIIQLAAESH